MSADPHSKTRQDPQLAATIEATEYLMATKELTFVEAAGGAPEIAQLVTEYQDWRTATGRIPTVPSDDEATGSRLVDRHSPPSASPVELPFGPPGGPFYQNGDEPLGFRFAKALEDPEDTLVREVEDELVAHWRRYTWFFIFIAVVVGLLRLSLEQLAIDFVPPWLVTAIAVYLAAIAGAIIAGTKLFRDLTVEVRERLQTRRACINAAAFRRTLEAETFGIGADQTGDVDQSDLDNGSELDEG